MDISNNTLDEVMSPQNIQANLHNFKNYPYMTEVCSDPDTNENLKYIIDIIFNIYESDTNDGLYQLDILEEFLSNKLEKQPKDLNFLNTADLISIYAKLTPISDCISEYAIHSSAVSLDYANIIADVNNCETALNTFNADFTDTKTQDNEIIYILKEALENYFYSVMLPFKNFIESQHIKQNQPNADDITTQNTGQPDWMLPTGNQSTPINPIHNKESQDISPPDAPPQEVKTRYIEQMKSGLDKIKNTFSKINIGNIASGNSNTEIPTWLPTIFGILFIMVGVGLSIYLLVKMSKDKSNPKCTNIIANPSDPPEPEKIYINKAINKDTVYQLIEDNRNLLEIYNTKYDNVKVNYRKAYYESLNTTSVQAWTPILQMLYMICCIIFIGIFLYKNTDSLIKKILTLLLILTITNVYVLKFIILFIIYLYNIFSVKYLYNVTKS